MPQKACIEQDGKYLVVKRADDSHVFPGHWDFPGGKLEHDESPTEGLQREVKEETALDIESGKPKLVFVEKVPDHYALIIVYESKITNGEIKLSKEHSDWKWVSGKEILEMKCEPYLKVYVQKEMM